VNRDFCANCQQAVTPQQLIERNARFVSLHLWFDQTKHPFTADTFTRAVVYWVQSYHRNMPIDISSDEATAIATAIAQHVFDVEDTATSKEVENRLCTLPATIDVHQLRADVMAERASLVNESQWTTI
jgi:hypothetical protein